MVTYNSAHLTKKNKKKEMGFYITNGNRKEAKITLFSKLVLTTAGRHFANSSLPNEVCNYYSLHLHHGAGTGRVREAENAPG